MAVLRDYTELVRGVLDKVSGNITSIFKNNRYKDFGLVYYLTDREGNKKPFATISGSYTESENPIIDDRYDVQWFHRINEVFANESPLTGYGRQTNWETVFVIDLVLSAKHSIATQLELINTAQYAIRRGNGTLLRRIETDMVEIAAREFSEKSYHIENQMIVATYEYKRTLDFNCLLTC